MFVDKVAQFSANFQYQHCVDFVSCRASNVNVLMLRKCMENNMEEEEHIKNYFDAFSDLTKGSAAICTSLDIPRLDWKTIRNDWDFIVALIQKIHDTPLEDSLKVYFKMTIGDDYRRCGDCGVYAMHLFLQQKHGDLPIFRDNDDNPLAIIRKAYLRICRDYAAFSQEQQDVIFHACASRDHGDIIATALQAANCNDINRFYEEIVKTEEQFSYDSISTALYCDGALLMAAANLILHEHGKPANITEDVTLTTLDEMIRMKMCKSLKPNHYYFVNSSNSHFVLCWIGENYEDSFSNGETPVIPIPSSPQKRSHDRSWRPKLESIQYPKADKMRYINTNVVKLLYEKCIPSIVDTSYTDGKKFQYPLPPDSLDNLVLLVSSTQSGKTNNMISMIWTSFFLYGFGTYYFVRNSAEEYDAINRAIHEFNNKISQWIRENKEKEEYRWVFESGGYDVSHYSIHCITQQQKSVARMSPEEFYIDSKKNMLRCVVRCKILVASNLITTLEKDRELRLMVQHYGAHQRQNTSRTEYSLNIVFIIDEAQNSYSDRLSSILRIASLKNYGELLKIGGVALSQENVTSTLSQAVALFIETSATPEASLLYVRDKKKPHILQIPLPDDYYGYCSQVPAARRFEPKCIEDLLELPHNHLNSCTDDDLKEHVRASLYTYYDNSMNEQMHAIVLMRNSNNKQLEDFAADIIDSPRIMDVKISRPVVIHLAYGRSGNHGSAIVFNETAKSAFEQYLLIADRKLFISKHEIPTKHSPGEYIKDPDDASEKGEVMYVPRRLSEDTIEIITIRPGVYKIGLPNSNIYRIRTQLSLTHEVMSLAGLDFVFAVTLGDRLLKEGIVVKTRDHEMPPKALICGYSHATFLRRALDNLLQAVGRLCGKRGDDRCPSLYMIGRNAEQFAHIIRFDEVFLGSVIRSGTHRRSVLEILQIGLSQRMGRKIEQIDNKLTSQKVHGENFHGRDFFVVNNIEISPSTLLLRKFLQSQAFSMRRALTAVLQAGLNLVEEGGWSSSFGAEEVNEYTYVSTTDYRAALEILKSKALNPSDQYQWIRFSNETTESIQNPPDEVVVVIRQSIDDPDDEPTEESVVYVHSRIQKAFTWCNCTGNAPIEPNTFELSCSQCGWEVHLYCHDATDVNSAKSSNVEYLCASCRLQT